MALALVASTALAAPAAQADDTSAVTACVVGPGVAGQTNVESVSGDLLSGGGWDPLRLLDSDTGSFSFQGPATCTGVDVAGSSGAGTLGLGPTVVAPTAVTITASGSYDNLICGTGTANGSATLVGGGINLSSQFGLTFVAGVGKLSLVNPTGNVGSDVVNGGEGTGVIQIIPTGSAAGTVACVNGNVNLFTVLGGFEATLSGENGGGGGTAPADLDSDDLVDEIWDIGIGSGFDCAASVVTPPHLSSTGGKVRARGRFECTEPVVQGAVIKVTVCLSVRQDGAWAGLGCETKSRQDGARQVERSIGRPCVVGQVRRYRVRVRGVAIDIVGNPIPGSRDSAEPEDREFFCPGTNNLAADVNEYVGDATAG